MSTRPNVLLIGFDPRTVPGVDADMVEMAVKMGQAAFDENGIEATECFITLGDPGAEAQITDALRRGTWDCVVVGVGIRKPEELLELFERVVNLIRAHAPQAAIGFNSNPTNSADAVLRVLPAAGD